VAHTFDREPELAFFPFDEVVRVAPLTATLSRDTRDEILDAKRGSFTSHAIEYATENTTLCGNASSPPTFSSASTTASNSTAAPTNPAAPSSSPSARLSE